MFLKEFFKKYIENTAEKAVVADHKMCLCNLTKAVMKGMSVDHSIKSVYITTRCLKHLFDKKPAEEFLFILNHSHEIIKYPDKIYKNKNGKRGEFCLIKKIGNEEYFCAIEIISTDTEKEIKEIQAATVFRLRNPKYIKNYTLLWDWGNGAPHRSALDTPNESTNAPQ